MPDVETPAVRSRADRYGQLAFTLVVCGLLAWGGYALVSLISGGWVQVTVGVIVGLGWLLVTAAGVTSALEKTKKP